MCLLSLTGQAQKANTGKVPDSTDVVSVGYDLNGLRQYTSHSAVKVNAEDLDSPETDVVKALYTKLAGLNISQGAGQPADNYASMSLHGHAPLVLVDGFPRDLNSLTLTEIESITVLKDATAMALYGVRGANGVVNIVTKRGDGKGLKITASYQFGLRTQFRSPEFADAYTYASQLNNALKLDGLDQRYSTLELEAFRSGKYPYAYPNVNWWDEVYKKTGTNHQLNLTFNGGNDNFKYFTALAYSWDRAMFDDKEEDSRYSTKPFDVRLNLRTNLDVNITKTTKMKLGLMGRMQEVNGINSLNNLYSAVYRTPSAAFPIRTEEGIYGGNNIYQSANPVALLASSGHRKSIYTTLYADLRLTQDLSLVTPGLSADLAISFDDQGNLWENSSKTYRYSDLQPQMLDDGTVVINPVVYSKDQQVIDHSRGFSSLYLRTDFQAKVGYQRTFGEHAVNGAAIYDQQSDVNNGRNNTYKRQSAILSLGYAYANRYFVDGVVSFSGTNVLPENHRIKTYPAISAAWMASNEAFWNIDLINRLKLRASYGLSGWDGNTPHELFRQGYGWASDYIFNGGAATGYGENSLPVIGLTIEKSQRATVGFDLGMWDDRLSVSAEYFYEKRKDILVDAANRVSGIIGIGVAQVNAGVNKYQGVDLSLGWKDQVGDFRYGVSGIFSFTRSEIVENNEAYQEYAYLYHQGNAVDQMYGLEAVGFFNDQVDINNSPVHSFATVKPGDIKYKDQNGDNIIDEQDVVKMFRTSAPEVYYGFNLNFAWKNFGISADFQGVANRTVNLLNSPLYQPLVNNGNISNTFLDREQTWTPENKGAATMPRLTTQTNDNNYRNNSLWYRDGSFFKLRNLQISYDLSKKTTRFADMHIYLRGTNLFSVDGIKFADPEQLSATYPAVRTWWAGVKFNF